LVKKENSVANPSADHLDEALAAISGGALEETTESSQAISMITSGAYVSKF
jgi:hypothetical protein